jgi:hypothetical protein
LRVLGNDCQELGSNKKASLHECGSIGFRNCLTTWISSVHTHKSELSSNYHDVLPLFLGWSVDWSVTTLFILLLSRIMG